MYFHEHSLVSPNRLTQLTTILGDFIMGGYFAYLKSSHAPRTEGRAAPINIQD